MLLTCRAPPPPAKKSPAPPRGLVRLQPTSLEVANGVPSVLYSGGGGEGGHISSPATSLLRQSDEGGRGRLALFRPNPKGRGPACLAPALSLPRPNVPAGGPSLSSHPLRGAPRSDPASATAASPHRSDSRETCPPSTGPPLARLRGWLAVEARPTRFPGHVRGGQAKLLANLERL